MAEDFSILHQSAFVGLVSPLLLQLELYFNYPKTSHSCETTSTLLRNNSTWNPTPPHLDSLSVPAFTSTLEIHQEPTTSNPQMNPPTLEDHLSGCK